LLYVIILITWLLFFNKLEIRKNIRKFFSKRKDINKLKYYFLKDVTHSIDRSERISNAISLNNIVSLYYFVSFLYIGSIFYLLNNFFSMFPVIVSFIQVILIFSLLLWLCSWIVLLIFRNTTLFFVCIPVIAFIIYSLFSTYLFDIPISLQLYMFLSIATICYFIFTRTLPLHFLRKLNFNIIIISALLTILTTVTIQSSPTFTKMLLNNEQILFTKEMVQEESAFSNEVKNFLTNEDVMNTINHFIMKEFTTEFTNILSLISAGITLSFLIGSLLVSLRISKAKVSAKEKLYTLLINEDEIKYEKLVEYAYKGGEECESIILSNPECLNVIRKHEIMVSPPPKTLYRNKMKSFFKKLLYIPKF
ncbi:MAG: hypothetical protein L0J18_10965, partial [Tetragenococcus koreensis]|nr:hypothetical protein [Tetragenococcus koreensis]